MAAARFLLWGLLWGLLDFVDTCPLGASPWCAGGIVSTKSAFCCPALCKDKCTESGCGEVADSCCFSHTKRSCANETDVGCRCWAQGCPAPPTPIPPTPSPPPMPARDAAAVGQLDLRAAISHTLPEFVSFNIDASELPRSAGFDWSSPRLARLAANLAPAFLRIGGSAQKEQKYDRDYFNYSWPGLKALAAGVGGNKAGGVRLIYGLMPNLDEAKKLIGRDDAAGVVAQWEFGNEPSQKDGASAGGKLGDAFVAVRAALDARFGRGNATLIGPDLAYPGWASPPVEGTDARKFLDAFFARVTTAGKANGSGNGNESGSSIDAAIMHIYPFDHNDVGGDDHAEPPVFGERGGRGGGGGGKGRKEQTDTATLGDPQCKSEGGSGQGWCNYTRPMWPGPGELFDTHAMQEFALPFAASARAAGVADVRVGETAAVNHGGWTNVTDGVVSGFWSLYQWGWLAQAGYTVVQRQSLACGPKYRDGKGAYGILSVSPTFEPNPDYWLSLLWTRLMGTAVLNASAVVTSGGTASNEPFATPVGLERTIRIFAHCSAPGAHAPAGAVTLAFANPQTFGVVLELASADGTVLDSAPRDEYRLAPPAGDAMGLRSRFVSLNGAVPPLKAANDGSVPALPAMRVNSGTLRVAPLTFGFIVLRNATAPACMN